MKLVFYSGGSNEENLSIDLAAIKLTGKKNPKMTLIPSCSLDGEFEFTEFVRWYRKLGITKFQYLPVDVPQDGTFLREAFKSDLIHLGGGNTYYFLKHLRKSSLLSEVKNFARKGGVLSGLSAGGILMTPDISTASYPSFDRDDNDDNIKNLKSMNLVDFDFFPHYKNSKRYDKELLKQSSRRKRLIHALPDGSGIIIDHDDIHYFGRSYHFHKNKKTKVN